MQILHVIHSLDPSTGGPPRVATRLAAGQAGQGHEVTLAAYDIPGTEQNIKDMVCRMPGYERVKVVQLPSGGFRERMFATASKPILRALIQSSDVIHLHNVWESILRVAAKEAQRMGKPYFMQPNDMLNVWALRHRAWKKKLALTLGYRTMIQRSSGMFFGHEEELRLAEQAGFQIRPHVLPLGGVFPQEIDPLPARGGFYTRYPQLHGKPFIVFLSRLHFKKGLDYLAESFALVAKAHPDVQLVVIGHDEGAQADFQARIARHQLQSRVHLVGPMHGVSKWEAYCDATCFVLPSRDEAFTVAINEALAASLPVVISQTCHFPQVQEYQAGFLCPLEPEAIAKNLLAIVNDPTLRARMAAAARRLFNDHLTIQQACRQTLDIYQQAVHASALPAAR